MRRSGLAGRFTASSRNGYRIAAVDALMRGGRPKFTARRSETILLDMWEKWVFLAALAGGTSLMRAAVGDIVAAPRGRDFMVALQAECTAIATSCGFAPRTASRQWATAQLTAPGSTFTASMMRDIEAGARIEADHVIGDMISRGRVAEPGLSYPLLEQVFTVLKAYEARRHRERP